MLGRLSVPSCVDLRRRAERTLAGDAHLVPALHHAFDFALNRQARLEGVLELSRGRSASRQFPRERQPGAGRHHDRLDAVADRDLERPILVFQLVEFDRGLALAADVDERDLGANRDDGALDGLAILETLGLNRRLEQRGKVFFLRLTHDTLLEGPSQDHEPAIIPPAARMTLFSAGPSNLQSGRRRREPHWENSQRRRLAEVLHSTEASGGGHGAGTGGVRFGGCRTYGTWVPGACVRAADKEGPVAGLD
jgi:hypothetical protein